VKTRTPAERKERRRLVITAVVAMLATHSSVGGIDLGELALNLISTVLNTLG
jgi:hypothetical protein